MDLLKYPRTLHLHGSRVQLGDEDLKIIPFSEIRGSHMVIEEKMDGANSAISFDSSGKLLLQSRGHFLTGGPRERHFALFKQWANCHRDALWQVLGDRYVMFGEDLYAKHTVFYDRLPAYWMEFDMLDRRTGQWLNTARRAELLKFLPVVSVRVLFEGTPESYKELAGLIGRSAFISASHLQALHVVAAREGLDPTRVRGQTDISTSMEGLYIKVEDQEAVLMRLKLVRNDFIQMVKDSDEHWLSRPIVPNQLCRPTQELFLPELPPITRTGRR